jgi:hypothetical protein
MLDFSLFTILKIERFFNIEGRRSNCHFYITSLSNPGFLLEQMKLDLALISKVIV